MERSVGESDKVGEEVDPLRSERLALTAHLTEGAAMLP
jgi:hypothetical protein